VTKKPSTPRPSRTPNVVASQRAGAGRPGARRPVAHARSHREERGARLAWIVGGGIAAVVILLFAVGYYNDNIGPARDTAIAVGNHAVSFGYYRDRLRAITKDTGDGTQTGAYNKESSTTDQIEQEQVYLQRAGSLGVSADDNDILAAMANTVRAPLQDGKLKDASLYESQLRGQLQNSGLSLDQFREISRAQALKDKVLAKFKADVPKQAPAIKAMQLTFNSEQQGRAAQQRLETGDSVNDIAQDATADPSIGQAQPLDWTPVPYGLLPAAVDDVASKLQPGQVSDLIKVEPTAPSGSPQWVLLAITDRDANHDVSDQQAQQIASKQQQSWFDQQKAALRTRSFVDGSKAVWAAQHTDLPLTTATPKAPAGNPRNGAPGLTPPTVPSNVQPSGPQPPAAPSAPAAPGGASGPPPPPAGSP
jgi:hypothetical protein